MADLEDAMSPTWTNVLESHANIADAAAGRLWDTVLDIPKPSRAATLVVRPRGWHLEERNVRIGGRSVSASLFDTALFLRHSAKSLQASGTGPFLYLPKMEHHLEAKLWNDALTAAESHLGLRRNSVRVSVLIETLPAAFQMDEILHELRARSPSLNAGRWDYMFSIIKCNRARPGWVLPDRNQVHMTSPFMAAYTRLLVQTAHRRGAYAIGGMAALIPDRRDPERNKRAIEAVRSDKRREARDGFDGTWVGHPDLVPVARAAFHEEIGHRTNQLKVYPPGSVEPSDLLRFDHDGSVTTKGVRSNCRAALGYVAAWLDGAGAVGLDGLMEDTATAEIARTQLWQWVRQGVYLEDDGTLTRQLFHDLCREELGRLRHDEVLAPNARARLGEAFTLVERLVCDAEPAEFLTLAAQPGPARGTPEAAA